MYTYIEFICVIGILIFIVLGINSYIKINGKALKNFTFTGVLFISYIFTTLLDPSSQTVQKEITAKGISIKPTEIVKKNEHSIKESCQKEDYLSSKYKNVDNSIKLGMYIAGCDFKLDKAPNLVPKGGILRKGSYKIVFTATGIL